MHLEEGCSKYSPMGNRAERFERRREPRVFERKSKLLELVSLRLLERARRDRVDVSTLCCKERVCLAASTASHVRVWQQTRWVDGAEARLAFYSLRRSASTDGVRAKTRGPFVRAVRKLSAWHASPR